MTFKSKLSKLWFALTKSSLFHKETNVKCPCCNWKGIYFMDSGIVPRKNALCPRCNSLERHRLIYLFLKDILPYHKPIRVLHVAPEKSLTKLFKSYKNINYTSIDIQSGKAELKQDITNLGFPNDNFDLILCLHVLEHVLDDYKAMEELFRVIKPNSPVIIQVPVKRVFNGLEIPKTYEDLTIVSPKERLIHFGQEDHVRIYSLDIKERLESVGFEVEVIDYASELGHAKIKLHALLPNEKENYDLNGLIYVCKKPIVNHFEEVLEGTLR